METADKAKSALTHKIGPFPAIVWGLGLGGLFVGYRYYKASKSVAPPITTAIDTALPSVGTSDNFSDGYGNATGNFGGSIIPGSTTTQSYQDAALATNSDWGKRVANYLISIGVLPSDAENAIHSYLYTSAELNSTQQAALNEALRHFGTPPEGVQPVPTTAPPVVVPPSPTGGGTTGNPSPFFVESTDGSRRIYFTSEIERLDALKTLGQPA